MKTYWIFAIIVGVLSASIGAWLGATAEEVFYRLGEPNDFIAPWIGGLWGFVIGICFVLVIGKLYHKYNAKLTMVGYATVIGAITGAIASSIVHGYLMIAYEEPGFGYLFAGLSFGMMAGIALGWVSSGVIRFYKKNPAILGI